MDDQIIGHGGKKKRRQIILNEIYKLTNSRGEERREQKTKDGVAVREDSPLRRVNRHKGGFSIKISLERTDCCSPPRMARRSRERDRERERERRRYKKVGSTRRECRLTDASVARASAMGKAAYLLEKSTLLQPPARLFEFAQLRPRFLHNANYKLCASLRSGMRASLFHSLQTFSRFTFAERERERLAHKVCVHFLLGAEYCVARILYLLPIFRQPIFLPYVHCLFLSRLFFFSCQEQRKYSARVFVLFENSSESLVNVSRYPTRCFYLRVESSRVLGRSFRKRFNLFSRLHGGKKRQGF